MAYEEHIDQPDDFDGDPEEIDAEEREALQQDLVDVNTLKSVLAQRGIKGVVVYCPDCEDDHFLGWDLLADNLRQILESGEPPVHEPAWEPDPDEYVTWDYALGFLDGYEAFTDDRSGEDTCAWCGSHLPEGGYAWAYCPTCGRQLGVVNLMLELRKQGWSEGRISELLERSGLEMPVFDPDTASPSSPDLDLTAVAEESAAGDPPDGGHPGGPHRADGGPDDTPDGGEGVQKG